MTGKIESICWVNYLLHRNSALMCFEVCLITTLMLLLVNLANAKNLKNDLNPGKWVLIWEGSARAFQWIPTRQCSDGFQNCLHSCVLEESSLSIERVNLLVLTMAKISLTILRKSFKQRQSWEIFEGEMLIRTSPTTLHRIFCKIYSSLPHYVSWIKQQF